MDVRCEKCLTVYEFDDAQVGPNGVTVKCTQCGNLFKVKRKDEKELPAVPQARPTPKTQQGIGDQLPNAPPQWVPAPLPPPRERAPAPQAAPPVEPNQFLIRLAMSGEVFKIFELGMLKDWILERKITREDQISRDGITWKPLGGVPELQVLFRQAEMPRQEVPLALSTTAPQSSLDGPSMMGPEDDVAHANTSPRPRVTPPPMAIPPVVDELAGLEDDELFPAKKRSSAPLVLLFLVILLGGGAGYLWLYQRPLVRGLLGGGRAQKSYVAAREKFLTDSDDGFRRASELFAEAHGADAEDPLPLAGLAEADATWAWYLREDARGLEATGPQAAAQLRKEAQGHLDDAKRAAQDALALQPESPEVNRAMADFLRVDGAPAAEVDRYLKRALEKRATDGEAVYVAGALAYRDGKLDEARAQLQQAQQLADTANQPLLRAKFLLAKLDQQTGKLDEARTLLNGVLQTNPQHERARTLLTFINGPAPTAAPDAAAAAAPPTAPTAPAPAAKTPEPVAAKLPAPPAKTPAVDEPAKPGDYNKLVAQADRLSENGHADSARKLYEKALSVSPQGVEALTGMAYCDLDKERYLSAIDRFKQALGISPEYGDALVGLAEAYKMQGHKSEAIDYYKRYLKVLPSGPKASMAKQNLRDLAPHEQGMTPATPEHESGTSLPRPPDETPPPPP
jgi:predicted Zn finger-like uncharacterized protein